MSRTEGGPHHAHQGGILTAAPWSPLPADTIIASKSDTGLMLPTFFCWVACSTRRGQQQQRGMSLYILQFVWFAGLCMFFSLSSSRERTERFFNVLFVIVVVDTCTFHHHRHEFLLLIARSAAIWISRTAITQLQLFDVLNFKPWAQRVTFRIGPRARTT